MSVSRVSYTGRWLQRIPPVSTRELIPPASLIHFSTSLTNLRLLWASSPSFTKVCVSECEDWKTEMWTPALMALGGRAGGEWDRDLANRKAASVSHCGLGKHARSSL